MVTAHMFKTSWYVILSTHTDITIPENTPAHFNVSFFLLLLFMLS